MTVTCAHMLSERAEREGVFEKDQVEKFCQLLSEEKGQLGVQTDR